MLGPCCEHGGGAHWSHLVNEEAEEELAGVIWPDPEEVEEELAGVEDPVCATVGAANAISMPLLGASTSQSPPQHAHSTRAVLRAGGARPERRHRTNHRCDNFEEASNLGERSPNNTSTSSSPSSRAVTRVAGAGDECGVGSECARRR